MRFLATAINIALNLAESYFWLLFKTSVYLTALLLNLIRNRSILTLGGKIPRVKLGLENIVRYYERFDSKSAKDIAL